MTRSLRGQLLFAVIGVTLGVYTLTSIGLYEYLKYKARSNLEINLREQFALVTGLLEEEDNGQRIELELEQVKTGKFAEPGSGFYYLVEISDQSPIMSNTLKSKIPDFARQTLPFNKPMIYEAQGPLREKLLVMAQRLHFARRDVRVYVAESQAATRRWLHDIRLALSIGVPIFLIVLGILVILVIRKALKPLEILIGEIETFDFRQRSQLPTNSQQVIELQKLNSAFNRLLLRFQKIRNSEEQLLVDVSHQLKTPLTIILSTCDVILQRYRQPERYRQALSQIQETGRDMRTLIQRLLSAAHLSAESREIENFSLLNLAQIAQQVTEKMQLLARQRGVTLDYFCSKSPMVLGDAERLQELLMILIENALLYSSEGNGVRVFISHDQHTAELTVSDEGPGIAEEDMPYLCERFYRGKNSEGKPGTGLGLALAQQIAEMHKGKVQIESQLKQGTQVHFTMPLTEAL